MALLATSFGSFIAFHMLRGHTDFISDMIKVASLIAIGTALLAYIFWWIANYKTESRLRGSMAGILTALFTVPLPIFSWTFKNSITLHMASPETSFLEASVNTAILAFKTSALTFSTVAGLAIPISAIIGYLLALPSTQQRTG